MAGSAVAGQTNGDGVARSLVYMGSSTKSGGFPSVSDVTMMLGFAIFRGLLFESPPVLFFFFLFLDDVVAAEAAAFDESSVAPHAAALEPVCQLVEDFFFFFSARNSSKAGSYLSIWSSRAENLASRSMSLPELSHPPPPPPCGDSG